MKIKGMDGEFAFKALYRDVYGWVLTTGYFFSMEEAQKDLSPREFLWPVDVIDNQTIYIPSQGELGEESE